MAVKKKFPEETIDSMLRRFKKEVVKAEILKDIKKREYYIAPSQKKRLKSAEARKRAMKNAAKVKQY